MIKDCDPSFNFVHIQGLPELEPRDEDLQICRFFSPLADSNLDPGRQLEATEGAVP